MAEMQRSDWLASMKSTHRRFGPSSLSCKDVVINGEDRKIMIINSDDFDLKYAHCIFDDFLIVGSYIEWNDETWIVTKEGGQKDVYPSYELQKCNYELKWVKDGETITKKAYASDMTYSQVGVQHTDYMVYGDSRYRVIIPKDDEPYTSFRPDETIDSFMSLSSISGRMTCSIPLFAATSKLMVELDRSIKDIAGIPYDTSKL